MASLFRIYKQNAKIIVEIFGIKMTFKNPIINHLEDCCFIPELDELRKEKLRYNETIKSAIENERTELGKSVLTQLADQLGVEL